MDHEFLFRLDEYRDRLGMVVSVSPAPGALGRETGSKTSQHYFDGTRYLRVADVMPHKKGGIALDHGEMLYAVELAREVGFTGIGLYPYWHPFPGLHLDMRDGPLKTWAMIPSPSGKQVEISMAEGWTHYRPLA